jgi:3-deoxy-D-arabino-heptulosonate 7-phosphate (DAHP) synthase class II
MTETLKFMLEQLIPEDSAQDETDRHKNVRRLTEPIETTEDKEFTQDEIRQIIEGFNPRKAPGRTELQVKF